MKRGLQAPIYDSRSDGNVFVWLIKAAQDFRKIRQRERYVELEKLAITNEKAKKSK